ncbi:uncharacterized protein ACBR49_002176 [Aulostomus maculatus]
MHQRNISEPQGVSTQGGDATPRTAKDGVSIQATALGSLRRGSSCCSAHPPRGAPLWAWLLLGVLVVPGAWSFLSEEQEELLVELHNHYRGQVSPSASAMLPLKWDTNLKLLAESYAAKCIWNHNPELEDTGENLFAGTGPLDLREALEKWFLEHLDYDFHNNSCDEDKMCGHYTQMVWADTHRVGCAFHLCNSMEGLDWERVSFLVCNYYPAGNYEGERPYVEGDWCSRCPENLQKCENNLCVPDTVEEEEGEEEQEEDEEETMAPPLVTSDPSIQQEEEEVVVEEQDEVEEEEKGVEEEGEEEEEEEEEERNLAPPSPTVPFLQLVTTASSLQDNEARPSSFTPSPGTYPPTVPYPTQGEEEEGTEEGRAGETRDDGERKEEEERGKEEEGKVEVKKKEEEGNKGKATTKDVVRNTNRNIKVVASAGSVSVPRLFLACLTGLVTLRL